MPKLKSDERKIRDFWIEKIKLEISQANSKFNNFHSRHEGYGVIKEEFDELWDEIKINSSYPGYWAPICEEAIQLAAMAIRFLMDCETDDDLWDSIINL